MYISAKTIIKTPKCHTPLHSCEVSIYQPMIPFLKKTNKFWANGFVKMSAN